MCLPQLPSCKTRATRQIRALAHSYASGSSALRAVQLTLALLLPQPHPLSRERTPLTAAAATAKLRNDGARKDRRTAALRGSGRHSRVRRRRAVRGAAGRRRRAPGSRGAGTQNPGGPEVRLHGPGHLVSSSVDIIHVCSASKLCLHAGPSRRSTSGCSSSSSRPSRRSGRSSPCS